MKKILSAVVLSALFVSQSSFVFADSLDNTDPEVVSFEKVQEDVQIETIDDAFIAEDNIGNIENRTQDITDFKIPKGTYQYMLIGNNVNVRSGAGTSYSSYGQMNWGDVCYSTGTADKYADGQGWKYVLCGSPLTGQYGWISINYLRETNN